jgi:hypothetical protein
MNFVATILIAFASTFLNCAAQRRPKVRIENTPVKISNESYASRLKSLEVERQKLAEEYRNAAVNKREVLDKARRVFVSSIEQNIFPFWYGTDWDFNGATETPREGKIACGYFVTTVLRDAGLRLSRVSLAQQASENIIKSLTTASFIKRFHDAPIEKFVDDVKKSGVGLYIVGLDIHVGFILNNGEGIYFIHSSYIEPSEVIREEAVKSPILCSSKYRVIGKISADDQMITKWLNQTAIPTIR